MINIWTVEFVSYWASLRLETLVKIRSLFYELEMSLHLIEHYIMKK
jgi:hypothetical protein